MDAFLRWLIALMIVGADENPIELLPQRQSDKRGVVPFQMREGVLQPYCNRAGTRLVRNGQSDNLKSSKTV
jgi:hypothetical protein